MVIHEQRRIYTCLLASKCTYDKAANYVREIFKWSQ